MGIREANDEANVPPPAPPHPARRMPAKGVPDLSMQATSQHRQHQQLSSRKKSETAMQTESANAAWKKYLHEAGANENSRIMRPGMGTFPGKMINGGAGRGAMYTGGKAVAVIRASQGQGLDMRAGGKGRGKQSTTRNYATSQETVYSDTEYMQVRSREGYLNSIKYASSYLTSPVRMRSGAYVTTTNSGGSNNNILTPWLQRNGYGLGMRVGGGSVTDSEGGGEHSLGMGIRRPSSVSANSGKMMESASKGRIGAELRKPLEKDGEVYSSALSLISNSTVFSTVSGP